MFLFDLTSGFAAFAKSKEAKTERIFQNGRKAGLEEGIRIGMKKHFECTSELSKDEQELLIKFLIRHNMILCYETHYGGFRVRKNDKLNPEKKKKVIIVDPEVRIKVGDSINTYAVSLAQAELRDYEKD